MHLFKNNISGRYALLFQVDSILILASSYLAFTFKYGQIPGFQGRFLQEDIFVAVICQLVLFINNLYEINSNLKLIDIAIRTILAFVISSLILSVVYLIFPFWILGGGLFLYALLIALIAVVLWRIVFIWAQSWVDPACQVVIYGGGSTAVMIAHEIIQQGSFEYKIVGFANDNPTHAGRKILGFDVFNAQEDLPKLIAERRVNKIVVALNQRRGIFPVNILLECKLRGAEVVDLPDFYEQLTGKILIKDLRPSWLIFAPGFRQTPAYQVLKRGLDIVMATVGLIITAPIMLITAVIIKLESPGPALFKQERVGEFGRTFTLLKFRSMASDAEKHTGPVWAQDNDSRITRVGNIIRKIRIDELPQMINVFKGDMSFVGPRPERPFFIKKLQERIPYYTQRLTVKPGITGWAAVKYQYSSTIEGAVEKLQYDLYYIKNISLWLDVLIILKTIQVVVTGRGSR